MTLLLAVLTASLLGSPHCAGMCGPFVCFYAVGQQRAFAPHLAYNLGRLASYVLLGAIAGAIGAQLNAAGQFAGVARTAAIVGGLLMVGWGVVRIRTTLRTRHAAARIAHSAPRIAVTFLGGTLRRFRTQPPVVRAGATGLLTTLLPCGWLYAFVATAAGTGSVVAGMAVMAVFWLGTLPALVAVGAGVQRLAGPLARRLPVASAFVLVALGLLAISGRLAMPMLHASHVAR